MSLYLPDRARKGRDVKEGLNPQRLLGFDILCEKNGYAYDPRFGWVSANRVADRWVPTTCDRCSGPAEHNTLAARTRANPQLRKKRPPCP